MLCSARAAQVDQAPERPGFLTVPGSSGTDPILDV